ncbi:MULTISPECIES: hypothetical protein [Bosea]|nr:hypothetical protein [Bosea vaviloviae]
MRTTKFPEAIAFRVATETAQQLDEIAKARGISRGELARSIVLQGAGVVADVPPPRRVVPNADILRDLLGQLGRHGSLLNQIARAMNSGHPSVDAEAALARMSAGYTGALEALRKVLGVTSAP